MFDLRLIDSFCPLCKADKISRHKVIAHDVSKKLFEIFECRRCGLAWQPRAKVDMTDGNQFFEERYRKKQKGTYFDTQIKSEVVKLQLEFVLKLSPLEKDRGRGDYLTSGADQVCLCTKQGK